MLDRETMNQETLTMDGRGFGATARGKLARIAQGGAPTL